MPSVAESQSGPEAALLRECLRCFCHTGDPDLLPALAGQVGAWEVFTALALEQEVAPLLAGFLRQIRPLVPSPVLLALHNEYRANAKRCLVLTTELRRILGVLEEAGIRPLVLKGLALAGTLYADPAQRATGDLDLLVEASELPRARALLALAGYQEPGAEAYRRAQDAFLPWYTELTLHNPTTGIDIDLHWELLPRGFPSNVPPGFRDRAVPFDLHGARAWTLSPADTLAFLLLHGGKHEWSSLKWEVDVRLLHGEPTPPARGSFRHQLYLALVPAPPDWETLRLPRHLYFVYFPWRWFRLALKQCGVRVPVREPHTSTGHLRENTKMLRLPLLVLFALLTSLCGSASAQEAGGRVGVPYDWSHRHTVFAQSGSFETQSALQSDPRWWHSQYRKSMPLFNAPAGPPLRARDDQGGGNSGNGGGGNDDADDDGHEGDSGKTQGAGAKVDWGESLGTSALPYGAAGNYPAKYSFNAANPTPDCTNDFVVFTLPTGTTTKANLVAFKNLYVDNSGTGVCPGTLPVALFTYNASQNAGSLVSSPALSLDGKQIAFIENASSAQFHVVKWRAGDVAATVGSPVNTAKMVNCATNGAVAPCEYSLIYNTGAATLSAPYIDYATDTAYVSNDGGKIVAISPVFGGGQPAIRFTITVAGSGTMTAPVYDSVSKNLFVADKTGKLYYIRTAATSNGACATGSAPCLGTPTLNVSNGKAIVETPVVDSASGTVFVFSNSSPTGTNSSVVQTDTKLSTSRVATVGPAGTQNAFAGAFSNSYFNSPATGMLYVCGTLAGNIPQLYGISFTGTLMNTGTAAKGPLALATATTGCSALTEVFNQSLAKDELYLSVATRCSATITGGCVKRFDITSTFPTAITNAVAENGGTTGLVIDNVSNGASGNASQTNIYFVTKSTQSCSKYTTGTQATANCAVKLTQAALQ